MKFLSQAGLKLFYSAVRSRVQYILVPVVTHQCKYFTMADLAGGDVNRKKLIGTHSGTFHCDEALACFMLRKLPEYSDAEIVRSRDQSVLDTCDIVVDVGGEYDPSKHRYDHHQRSFTGTMNSLCPDKPWETKLSSAGLVYLHFGERVLKELMGKPVDKEKLDAIYDKVYENFMEEIDAIDNGVDQYDGEPRYIVSTNLSSRVKHLNPNWNEPPVDMDERFLKAVELVGMEFVDRVMYYSNSWWPARELVEDAMKNRFEVHESGEIVIFGAGGCPWKEHLYALEKEMGVETPIKYVLYTDQANKWRVQCVSVAPHSFENRLSLPEKWRGMRNNELSEIASIPNCIFVHSSGFIGGNETKEGALQMAIKALTMDKS